MPASYTSGQPSNPHRHPTCWASTNWSHTVSRTPCHGAWTSAPLSAHLPIECRCTAPKIETPICTRRTSHQFIWQQQHTCSTVGGLPMECGMDGQPEKGRHRHPSTPKWSSQEKPGSSLTTSALVLDVSTPACTNGVWPPLRPVSVAQKNKPLTTLSSNVQSIDLPMDCMAWRFWTMRQLNGCATPAPISSAAKQWFQQLAQKKKNQCSRSIILIYVHTNMLMLWLFGITYKYVDALIVRNKFFSWYWETISTVGSYVHTKQYAQWSDVCSAFFHVHPLSHNTIYTCNLSADFLVQFLCVYEPHFCQIWIKNLVYDYHR